MKVTCCHSLHADKAMQEWSGLRLFPVGCHTNWTSGSMWKKWNIRERSEEGEMGKKGVHQMESDRRGCAWCQGGSCQRTCIGLSLANFLFYCLSFCDICCHFQLPVKSSTCVIPCPALLCCTCVSSLPLLVQHLRDCSTNNCRWFSLTTCLNQLKITPQQLSLCKVVVMLYSLQLMLYSLHLCEVCNDIANNKRNGAGRC